ncbi:hypothetical protein QVD17_12474 [Tagetes erecta]|uniref:Retrotransposon gag domain-containing protein n=1 Tax=Tagetes erecta TaxID=13708 RepID=A0AAD8KUW3_TARER|nr:hypothetical protein QVD17_12474 [Tagetes erecta]
MATDASKLSATEENRGRGDTRKTKKERDLSKDKTWEKRLGDLETGLVGMGTQVDICIQRLDALEADFTDLRIGLKAAVELLREEMKVLITDSIKDAIRDADTKLRRDIDELSRDMHRSLLGLESRVNDCSKAIVTTGGNVVNIGPRVEIPKPSPFVGKREARAVDDFIWEMEQYLAGVQVLDDATKVKTATMYLKDTAALWWRRRSMDIERGTCTIKTWAEFVQELKRQFYPVNAEHEARSRLRKLKQTGTIKAYVKEFTTLILEIPDLSDKDSLFYFLDGLQPWAKIELERRNVQDLASAIAIAESLIDHKEKRPLKPMNEDCDEEFGGGDKPNHVRKVETRKPPRHDNDRATRGCFICDGPHNARYCPKKQSLQAMVARSNDDASQEDEEARLGAMQLQQHYELGDTGTSIRKHRNQWEACEGISGHRSKSQFNYQGRGQAAWPKD